MATKRTRKSVPVFETVPQSAEEKQADEARISYIAYQLFLSRGGVQGYELQDWLNAERMLADGRRGTRAVEQRLTMGV